MSLRLITASFLSLTFAASVAFAAEKIPCPAINSIAQTADKVDTAEKYGDTFVAYTSTIAYKDSHPWFVGVANINATNSDDALATGKQLVRNISLKKNENAVKYNDYFYCLYGKGDVVAITGNFGVKGMMFKH